MEQFVVPQFIDVEDKIIGPLSIRQFIILLIAGLSAFLEYKLADFTLFLLEGILTITLGGIIAFTKVNGMPIHVFLLNLFQNARRPKTLVWQKAIDDKELKDNFSQPVTVAQAAPASHKPSLQQSRLQELTLLVDTGGAFKPESEEFSLEKS